MMEAHGSRFPDSQTEVARRSVAIETALYLYPKSLSEDDRNAWYEIVDCFRFLTNGKPLKEVLDAEFVFYLDHSGVSDSDLLYQLGTEIPHAEEKVSQVLALAKQVLFSGHDGNTQPIKAPQRWN